MKTFAPRAFTPETFETRKLYKPTRELLHQTTSTLEFEHTHKPLLPRTSFAELLLHQRLLRQKYLHQKLDTKELLQQRPCARRLLLHNPFTPPEGALYCKTQRGDADQRNPVNCETQRDDADQRDPAYQRVFQSTV